MSKSLGQFWATNIIKNHSWASFGPLNDKYSSTLVDVNSHLSPLNKRKLQGRGLRNSLYIQHVFGYIKEKPPA